MNKLKAIGIAFASMLLAIYLIYFFDNANLSGMCISRCKEEYSKFQSNPYEMVGWIQKTGGTLNLSSWLQKEVECRCTMKLNGQRIRANLSNMTEEEIMDYFEDDFYNSITYNGTAEELNITI